MTNSNAKHIKLWTPATYHIEVEGHLAESWSERLAGMRITAHERLDQTTVTTLAGRAGDAGTVFTNPAGMTRFKKPTIQAGITPFYLHAPFDPDNNTTVEGSNGDSTLFFAGANFAYIHPVSDDLKLGVSLGNHFGLVLDWGDNWAGRFVSTEVAMQTLISAAIHAMIGFEVPDGRLDLHPLL